jgi:hypothetical protein
MRAFAILPPEAVDIISRSRNKLKQLIARNIEVEHPKMDRDSLADLLLTFFTGLSMEHNLSSSRRPIVRKIDDLMSIVRTLWLTTAGALTWPSLASLSGDATAGQRLGLVLLVGSNRF